MNFELVFGCGAMFCPASFFTFAPPYTKPPMDKDLYHELGTLTKRKEDWKDNIPFVGSLLENQSTRIMAKALWLLGEMGMQYPEEIEPYVASIATFLDSQDDLLRERSLNALGRIGRTRFETVKPYWEKMFGLATDRNPRVRLSFIWASENIATNAPDPYQDYIPLYAELLHDSDDKVRMEAPEMFRVLGKRRPHFVKPYLELLQHISETDGNSVVRIHCLGAIKAASGESFNEAFC